MTIYRETESRAFRECEDALARFHRHARTCGICGAAQPDPESAPADALCARGNLWRSCWEGREANFNRRFGHVREGRFV